MAGVACLAITGTEAGPVTAGLAGYTVLMLLVLLRLLPVSPPARLQSRLLGLHLLLRGRGHGRARVDRGEAPRGATAYAVIVVALISVMIIAVAFRSGVAAARGQFLPKPQMVRGDK